MSRQCRDAAAAPALVAPASRVTEPSIHTVELHAEESVHSIWTLHGGTTGHTLESVIKTCTIKRRRMKANRKKLAFGVVK